MDSRPRPTRLTLIVNSSFLATDFLGIKTKVLMVGNILSITFKKLFGLAKLLILGGCDLAPLYEWISVILSDRRQREAEREEQRRFGIFPTNQQEEEV